jgi:hypothetical protein
MEKLTPFIGRWKIFATWDPSLTLMDFPVKEGYFQFDSKGGGTFLFDDFKGQIDWRLTTWDGEAAVEWTSKADCERLPDWKKELYRSPQQKWNNPLIATGQGGAVLRANELHGYVCWHQHAKDSWFEASRCDEQTVALIERKFDEQTVALMQCKLAEQSKRSWKRLLNLIGIRRFG